MTETVERKREALEVEVMRAGPAEIGEVVSVLARAFDDDPLTNWAVAQDGKREERIHRFFDAPVRRLGLKHGEIYTTSDALGAAVWLPPGGARPRFLEELRMLPAMVRCTTLRRFPKVMRGFRAVDRRHPRQPHWYLMAVGVEPAFQGRSVGTQLMAPVLERCDARGIPAYLESSKERNIPLYERNGFRVTEELTVPGNGPKVWLMWRDPRPPQPGQA